MHPLQFLVALAFATGHGSLDGYVEGLAEAITDTWELLGAPGRHGVDRGQLRPKRVTIDVSKLRVRRRAKPLGATVGERVIASQIRRLEREGYQPSDEGATLHRCPSPVAVPAAEPTETSS